MRKPVTVQGKPYPSMAAACREYGLELATVSARIQKLGMSVDDAFTKPLSKNRGKSLLANGVRYRSVAAAAKAHDIPPETLTVRLREGYAPSIAVMTFHGMLAELYSPGRMNLDTISVRQQC